MAKRKSVRQAVEKVTGKLAKHLEIDHIVPKAEGGTDHPGNLQVISKPAHKVKTAVENKVRQAASGRGRAWRRRSPMAHLSISFGKLRRIHPFE